MFRGFRGKKGAKLTRILVIVLAIAFVGGLLYTGSVMVREPSQDGYGVIATINGRSITREAFEQGYRNAILAEYEYTGRVLPEIIGPIRASLLDQFINTALITEAAQKEKIRVSSKEINEEFKLQEEAFPGKEAFREALAANNVTEAQFKNLIKDRLTIQKLFAQVQAGVQVSEEEIKQAYTDETGNPAEGEDFDARRSEIETTLRTKAQEDALTKWLDGLRDEADIKLMDAELRALAKLREQDYGEAIAEYNSAIALDPDNAYLHVGIAQAHMANDDLEHATEALKNAADLRPEDPYIRLLLGLAYRDKGSKDLAAEEFKAASEYGGLDILLHVRLESLLKTVGTDDDVKTQQAKITEIRALLEERDKALQSQEQADD
ncbi:MAG: tetratricopeptide repeat protein [Firmicutes bacterium]|nr:tetratricopeptide repeat protein [Bacillota bacterium]